LLTLAIYLLAGAFFAWKFFTYGRIGNLITLLLLLFFTILFIVKIFRKDFDKKGKFISLRSISLVCVILSVVVSPFINGLIVFRPVYAYENYYVSEALNNDLFPEKIPNGAVDIKFLVLGEGISGNVYYSLSFSTDEKNILALKENALEKANSVAIATKNDMIPEDIAPDFIKDNIEQCTVYTLINEYGDEGKIFVSVDNTRVCYYQD